MRRLVVAGVIVLGSTVGIAAAGAGQIASVAPASGPTAGGITLTLTGSGFGAAGNLVMVGASHCAVTSETSDQIECTLPPGSGASRPIRVVDGPGSVSPPYPFGYEPPAITNITAASAPTAGGVLITIAGTNFGSGALDRRVTVHGAVTRVCDGVHVEQEDVLMTCTLPPGEGQDVPVDVIIDGQTSTPATLDYDPPSITFVTPSRAPANSGFAITIVGENFGRTAAVTLGGVTCPVTAQSSTHVICAMPPNGVAPLEVSLTVAGQASNAVPFSYQVVASACDAKKMKAVGSLSTCIDNVYIKAVKKGLDPDVEALATCTEKFTASCTKAETKLDDCTRVDTCAETIAAVVPEFVETVWNKQCVEKDTVVRLCDEH